MPSGLHAGSSLILFRPVAAGVGVAEGGSAQVAGRRVLPRGDECGDQPGRRPVVPGVAAGEESRHGRHLAEDGHGLAVSLLPGELPRGLLSCERRRSSDY